MNQKTPKFPFEVSIEEILKDHDRFVDSVFSCLASEFLVMPKGEGFVDYPVFERGYEALKVATNGFAELHPKKVLQSAVSEPISIIVLRSMLGFTPPEWGYLTTQQTGVHVTQGFVRSIDRKIRKFPAVKLELTDLAGKRLEAMIKTACRMLSKGAPKTDEGQLHRLEKADTKHGISSIQILGDIGVPYAMLLYERFLGRPYAGHRDSVSEMIGNTLEVAIENVLQKAAISFRKTKRAERIHGFDQVPDFIIPSEFNPQVVIEAKITEDDGTARDKVTRIQHLWELSNSRGNNNEPGYEVVACIGGRGFGIRREDMKKLLIATRGKVFTVKTLDRLVECTRLKEFRARK